MKSRILILLCLTMASHCLAQAARAFADSIRKAAQMPELNYAVVCSDRILEMQALGHQKIHSDMPAALTDQFRIGSLTKTVTSYLAALLVKQGKIRWHTRFFDLYPELKAKSHPAYAAFTLQDLLTFRANLPRWSYGNDAPTQQQIQGNPPQQRYGFVAWSLQQEPDLEGKIVFWSNPSYVAAGLMLEKVTGKTYETLVDELGKQLGIRFGFGQPNRLDSNQPWGHDEALQAEPPGDNFKLNWLSSAGNLHVSLPDYAKFIQVHLQGLRGKSSVLTAEDFHRLHFGLPQFSYGWRAYVDPISQVSYSFHEGNPGTFLTRVYLSKNADLAFILFTNVQSESAEIGLQALFDQLTKTYGRQ